MKKLLLILPIIAIALMGCGKSDVGLNTIYKSVTPLNVVTASSTSSAIDIKGAKRVTLVLSTDIPKAGYGTTTFDVDVSIDGSNYYDYNKLVENLADTNSQSLTRISSKSFSATSTGYIVSMDLESDVFESMKITATMNGAYVTNATTKTLIEF